MVAPSGRLSIAIIRACLLSGRLPPRRRGVAASGSALGMMGASAGSAGGLGDDAGGRATLVAQLRQPRGIAQPAAQKPVGGVEDVVAVEPEPAGGAFDRLDRVALGVGVAAFAFEGAQDLRQAGEAVGIVGGHRWRPSIGATGCGAFYAPEPRGLAGGAEGRDGALQLPARWLP